MSSLLVISLWLYVSCFLLGVPYPLHALFRLPFYASEGGVHDSATRERPNILVRLEKNLSVLELDLIVRVF